MGDIFHITWLAGFLNHQQYLCHQRFNEWRDVWKPLRAAAASTWLAKSWPQTVTVVYQIKCGRAMRYPGWFVNQPISKKYVRPSNWGFIPPHFWGVKIPKKSSSCHLLVIMLMLSRWILSLSHTGPSWSVRWQAWQRHSSLLWVLALLALETSRELQVKEKSERLWSSATDLTRKLNTIQSCLPENHWTCVQIFGQIIYNISPT